jgi:hypothetical protein
MSKRYVFPSIAGRQVGYVLHTDSMALWDAAYRTAKCLGPRHGWFQTYGDGITQHESERPVTLIDAQDYFASLGHFMAGRMEQPFEDGKEERELFWCWPTPPTRERIEFALSVVHKPAGKSRYFTMHGGDFKVSARDRLAHDKRWHLVKELHDGSVSSALSVLYAKEDAQSIAWLLESWVDHDAVVAVAVKESGWAPETARRFLGKEASHDEVRALTDAFELAKLAFGALGARLTLKSKLENYRNNRLPKPVAADEEVAS